jgi:hypothetical protein
MTQEQIETRAASWGRRSFVALAVLLGSGAAGCASGRATFNSQTNLAGTAPIQRLLVVEDDGATGLTADMRTGLQTALANGFWACGVASTMLAAGAVDLNPRARIGSAAKDLATAAVLKIEPAEGSLYGKYERQLHFALKVVDLESRQVTWLANAEFDVELGGQFTNEVRSGERLGTSIVSRLRDDGVLPGCPSLVAGWPLIPHPEPQIVEPTRLR